jgi:hypothetical protein
MKPKRKFPLVRLLLIAMALRAPSPSPGQTPAPAPPFDGPPIAKAPNPAAYLITVTNAVDEAEKKRLAANPKEKAPVDYESNRIVKWQVARSGTVADIRITAKSGQTGQIWLIGSIEIVRPPGAAGFFLDRTAPREDPFHLDFGRYGFPFTAWVGMSNFDQKMSINGKPVLHFGTRLTEKVESNTSAGIPAMAVTGVEAWIDFDTRFPLFAREQDNTYSFKYLPAPTTPLAVPDAVNAVVACEVQRMKRLSAVPCAF